MHCLCVYSRLLEFCGSRNKLPILKQTRSYYAISPNSLLVLERIYRQRIRSANCIDALISMRKVTVVGPSTTRMANGILFRAEATYHGFKQENVAYVVANFNFLNFAYNE